MIKSMTGFGKSTGEYGSKKFSVEVRSLNSKGFDLTVKMSSLYREKELELRNELGRELERGKVDVSIYFEDNGMSRMTHVNKDLVKHYYTELSQLNTSLGIEQGINLALLLQMPEVMQNKREEFDNEEWNYITTLVKQATAAFNQFRLQEGAVLQNELEQRIGLILNNLIQVETLSDERKHLIKARLLKSLEEVSDKLSIDHNRFEQEVVYYLEKQDITEERVRLRAHCDYFLETIKLHSSEGKKLGFISQEIGREINTIGSKCSDAEIQRFVVQMKDELEKIKEQVLNVL